MKKKNLSHIYKQGCIFRAWVGVCLRVRAPVSEKRRELMSVIRKQMIPIIILITTHLQCKNKYSTIKTYFLLENIFF